MNKTIITIGSIFAVVNLLIGLIVSAFGWINIVISTAIIVATTLLLLAINNGYIFLKEGFKVSLGFIIPTFGLIEYLFAVFMPNKFADNWCLIVVILLCAMEAGLLISAHNVSTKIR